MTAQATATLINLSEYQIKKTQYIFKEKKENFSKTDFRILHQNPIAGMILNFVTCPVHDEYFLFDVDCYSKYSGHNPKTIRKNIHVLIDANHCVMIKQPGKKTEYFFSRYPFSFAERKKIFDENPYAKFSHTKKRTEAFSKDDTDSNSQTTENIKTFTYAKKRPTVSSSNINNITTNKPSNNNLVFSNPVPKLDPFELESEKKFDPISVAPFEKLVVVEKKSKEKNTDRIDFEEQLSILEEKSNTIEHCRPKTVTSRKEVNQQPVMLNLSPAQITLQAVLSQLPDNEKEKLSIQTKESILRIISNNLNYDPDHLTQYLIYAINRHDTKRGSIPGLFSYLLKNKTPIEKQITQNDIEKQRIKQHIPIKPMPENERKKIFESVKPSLQELKNRLRNAKIEPDPNCKMKNTYWERKGH